LPHFIDQISLPPQSDQTNRILIQLSHLITAFLTTSLDLLGRSITEIYGKVKILQGIIICCTEFFFRLYSGERRISLIAAKMGEQVSDFEIKTTFVVLLEILFWLKVDTVSFFLLYLLSSLVCFWNIIGGSKQIFIFFFTFPIRAGFYYSFSIFASNVFS